jgi:molybdate/tungstate transport system permease protein
MSWLRAISLATALLLLAPIVVLLYYGLGPLRTPAGFTVGIFRSISLSVVSSALAAMVDVALFTPLAYYLARSDDRLVESLIDVPVGIPHPIVGVALLILDSPLTPTGQFLLFFGVNFFNTLLGLVVALVVMSAPIYVKSMQPYLESRDA